MSEERWRDIQPLLDQFADQTAAHVPRPQILLAVDRQWSDEEYKARRPDGFPSRLRGVYLIFDSDEHLLYVGLAMSCFDSRVWDHDDDLDRRWTDIVPFDNEHIFLAPALEFYLIAKLKPPHNKVYSDYDLP
jgi:hypothetical protein